MTAETRISERRAGALLIGGLAVAVLIALAASGGEAKAAEPVDRLLAAQCRYADGTGAAAYWRKDIPIIMVSQRVSKDRSYLFKIDGSVDPARTYQSIRGDDGVFRFEEVAEKSGVKAILRIGLALAARTGTWVGQSKMAAFEGRADAPACPCKTFEVAPGDVNLQDLKSAPG
jgi:hypothetical protein